MSESSILLRVMSVVVLIIAAVLHEIAHAVTASKLGDPTARLLGRYSLNPIKHIDPFLTIILPGLLVLSGSPIIFGGAKPVPVNAGNFRNPLKGMAIVAAAGPACNFILAGLGWLLVLLLSQSGLLQLLPFSAQLFIVQLFFQWVIINLVLAVFNLFPVPPLDGGRIVTGLLPSKLALPYARLEPYGLLLVFFLLYIGVIDSYLMFALDFVFGSLVASMQ